MVIFNGSSTCDVNVNISPSLNTEYVVCYSLIINLLTYIAAVSQF